MFTQNPDVGVQGSFYEALQNWKTNIMPPKKRTGKQTRTYLFYRILLSTEKEQPTDTYKNSISLAVCHLM